MTIDIFQDFARFKGYTYTARMAYGMENGYPVLLQYLSENQWRVTVTANIPQPAALQGRLGVQLNRRTASKLLCKPDSVSCTLRFHGENIGELYHYLLSVIFQQFSMLGVVPLTFCPFCGQDHCDSLCVVQDRYAPVHEACAAGVFPPATYEEPTTVPDKKNYVTGILGAILGLLVGALPQLALNYFTGYSLMLLYLLPPVLAFFGYKLLKGPATRTGKIICTALSVVFSPLLAMGCVLAAVTSYEIPLQLAFSLLPWWMTEAEFAMAVVSDFLYGILFTVLGSLLGWRFILGPGRMPCETFRNHMATLRPLHGEPLPSPSEEPSENDPEY